MGEEAMFHPPSLRALGKNFEAEVGALIKQARYKLNAKPRDVEPDAFTTLGYALAMVHVEVIEYADVDLRTKAEKTMDVNDRLHRTANNQEDAEDRSTLWPKGV